MPVHHYLSIREKKKKYNLVLLSVHFEAVIVSTIVTGNVAFKSNYQFDPQTLAE